MFMLKKGHQPGVYVPLRALFLVLKRMARISWLKHNTISLKSLKPLGNVTKMYVNR